MAEGKESFIFHMKWKKVFDKLKTKEQKSDLLEYILSYVSDENPSHPEELWFEIAFEMIKHDLKKDLDKWKIRCNSNRINGLKGGRPKKPKKPTGFTENPPKPKKAEGDSECDSDSEYDNESETKKVRKKPTIDDRMQKFQDELKPHVEKYGAAMIKNFYNYWTESSKTGKMRFEGEKYFDTNRRLALWNSRSK